MISESLKDIVLNKVSEKKKRKIKSKPESRFDRTTKVHKDITQFLGHTDPDPELISEPSEATEVQPPVVAEKKVPKKKVSEKKKYTNMKPRKDMETMTIPTDSDKDEKYKDHKVFTKDPKTEEDDEIWYGQGADGEMEEPEANEVIYRESDEDDEELVDVDSLTEEQYLEYMIRQGSPDEYMEYLNGQEDPDSISYLDPEEEAKIVKLSGGNVDADEVARQNIEKAKAELIAQQQLQQPVVEVEPESIDSYMDIPEVELDIESVLSKMQSLSFEETPDESYGDNIEIELPDTPSMTLTPDITDPTNNIPVPTSDSTPPTSNFVDDMKSTLNKLSPEDMSNNEFSGVESLPTIDVDMAGTAEDLMAKINALTGE